MLNDWKLICALLGVTVIPSFVNVSYNHKYERFYCIGSEFDPIIDLTLEQVAILDLSKAFHEMNCLKHKANLYLKESSGAGAMAKLPATKRLNPGVFLNRCMHA